MYLPLRQHHDGASAVSSVVTDTTRVSCLEGKTAIVFGISPAIGSHVARALADARGAGAAGRSSRRPQASSLAKSTV
jgi:hypothetical protein